MLPREDYLNKLIRFREKQIIKVVTGVRCCGKTMLLKDYQNYLLSTGVRGEQIIYLDLEDGEYFDIQDGEALYELVSSHLISGQMNYIFLDEVQRVRNFQKAVEGLYGRRNCDVYIAGSNADLLKGEFATPYSGRYVEIRMLPLSFRAYASVREKDSSLFQTYQDYIHYGSFPYELELKRPEDVQQYLDGVFNTVLVKDILTSRHIGDVDMLIRVARLLFDNVGKMVTSKGIADALAASGRRISVHTVDNYLEALTACYLFYRAGRYDIKGEQYLKTGCKYYAVDVGMLYHILGTRKEKAGHILENVVYLELLRRGYEVQVGKVGSSEAAFASFGDEGREYYNVAYTVVGSDGKNLDRKLAPLAAIHDYYPKYLLTMDYGSLTSYNGIRQIYVLDWLLK